MPRATAPARAAARTEAQPEARPAPQAAQDTTPAAATPSPAAETGGKPQAFNLIIEGVAYVNRLRTVRPAKGPAYQACTLNAMMGTADAVEYVSIDCRIVGRQAIEAILLLEADLAARRKVIVGFRAGDPRPDFYEFKDRSTGEPKQGEGLKARLLQLTFAKVDGRRVAIPLVERPADRGDEPPARGSGPTDADRAEPQDRSARTAEAAAATA